jgi:hypothetical protein
MWLLYLGTSHLRPPFPPTLVLFIFFPLIFWFSLRLRPTVALGAKDSELLGSVGTEPKWFVGCTIVQDGVTTGRDRGVLYVEEGSLKFEGHRCKFSVDRRVIEDLHTGESGNVWTAVKEGNGWLRIAHPSRDVRVALRFIPAPGASDLREDQAIIWRLTVTQSPNPSQLFPLGRDPLIPVPMEPWKKFSFGIALTFALGVCIAMFAPRWEWGLTSLVILPLVLLAEPSERDRKTLKQIG